MQHVFVVNTYAGAGCAAEFTERALARYRGTEQYEIYYTKHPADATAFVIQYCETHTDPVRFYACGGDGTLQEVCAGVLGYEHASVTAYACGSGNDYVCYYGKKDDFLDINALFAAPSVPIDLIETDDGRIAVNAFHFGFDSAVAEVMNTVRHKKLIGGKNAYTTGIVKALVCDMSTACTVTVDGEVLNPDGEILLCTVANGEYVGGGFHCAPLSRNDDGEMEICLVKPVSRFTLLKLMDAYKTGQHLTDKRFAKYVVYRRGKEVTVSSPNPQFVAALDGELLYRQHITAKILPRAIQFAVPEKLLKKEDVTV